MTIASGNFSRLLEPGLRKIFFETYKEKPEQYSKVFNVLDSTKAVETDHRMGGFTLWNKKGSLDSTEYEDIIDGGDIMYKHETFSKGFQIEKELVDDAQYNTMNKRSKALARTARATVETHAASVYNGAFTANGYDGVPLIHAAHPLLGGGTSTNSLGSAVLNEANLELALKLSREQVDERGIKIQMMPKILVVPGALEYTAARLIESAQSTTPGGANVFAKNDINAMKGKFEVVVLDYLTSPTAWFVIDPDLYEINFFWREKLNFKSDGDFDTDVAKYKGRMRYSYGWSDFRGIIGSAGA